EVKAHALAPEAVAGAAVLQADQLDVGVGALLDQLDGVALPVEGQGPEGGEVDGVAAQLQGLDLGDAHRVGGEVGQVVGLAGRGAGVEHPDPGAGGDDGVDPAGVGVDVEHRPVVGDPEVQAGAVVGDVVVARVAA